MPELVVAPKVTPEGPRARPAGEAVRRRRGRALLRSAGLPLAATLTTTLSLLTRSGYSFGMEDQAILALKGIARADPTAFVGDWFTGHVPQPHWLFDLVTYAGERFGVLPLAYLLWWVGSLGAFGVASAWLARRFLPERTWLALLVGPVLAFGPLTAFGSGTALWGYALPQSLGACLGFLTVSALLTGRWRAAAIAAVLAGLAHVQHGADLAPILLGCAALSTMRPLRHRLGLAATAVALVTQAAIVGQLRGIENGGDGWLEACRVAIPFHCDANSWAPVVFVAGGLVAALSLSFAFGHRRQWRAMAPAVAFPAVGLVAAALADRLDLPVIGHLVQRFNAYRLAGLVLPLAAFALVWLIAGLASSGWTPRRAAGVTILLVAWFTVGDAAFSQAASGRSLLATGLLLVGAAALTFDPGVAGSGSGSGVRSWSGGGRFAVALGLLLVGQVTASGLPPAHLGYDRSDTGVAAALVVGDSTEPGAVIAADPAIYWLRAVSRRAVVAECKGIAFGGAAWVENAERIAALGGWACTPGPSRFAALTPSAVEALHARFGATHVLLTGDDPKLAYAQAHWPLVRHVAAGRYPFLQSGWWLFRIDVPVPR